MVAEHSVSNQHQLKDRQQEKQRQKRIKEDSKPPPLIDAVKTNVNSGNSPGSREIASRFKITVPSTKTSISASFPSSVPTPSSPGPSRRCLSPSVVRSQTRNELSNLKRAQSAERRRQSSPSKQNSDASKLGTNASPKHIPGSGGESLWPSMRSAFLSIEKKPSVSSPKIGNGTISRALDIALNSAESAPTLQKKATSERKRTSRRQSGPEPENAGPSDNRHSKPNQQHLQGKRLMRSALTESMDLAGGVNFSKRSSCVADLLTEGQSSIASNGVGRSRFFQPSVHVAENIESNYRRSKSFVDKARTPTPKAGNSTLEKAHFNTPKSNAAVMRENVQKQTKHSSAFATNSDVASYRKNLSVGSGSNLIEEGPNSPKIQSHSTSPGLRSSMPELTDLSPRLFARMKALSSSIHSRILHGQGRASTSPRLQSNFTGTQHSASPPKIPATSSPSKALLRRSYSASSALIFGVDVQKGKKGISQAEDLHYMKMLHNRLLQWRFVNARTEAAMHVQKVKAEKLLCNVCIALSELRDSVMVKQIKLQNLRQECKLFSILSRQLTYLEEWAHLGRDHLSSLSGAIEALLAATLRLPVTDDATAKIQEVNRAMKSAFYVMETMVAGICVLFPKVKVINNLVSELVELTAKERTVLGESMDLLTITTVMEVEELSLRTYLIQLKDAHHDLIKPSD